MAKNMKYIVNGKKRCWIVQRNYQYESQQSGESESQWRDRVSAEWRLDGPAGIHTKTTAAISATVIFHDRDIDDDGNPKGLHAHGIMEFKEHAGITQEQAMAWLGVSAPESCQPPRSGKSAAYQYLTHVSQSAMAARKIVYDRADLQISLLPDQEQMYRAGRLGLVGWYYDACSNVRARDAELTAADRKKKAVNAYVQAVSRGQVTADQAYDLIEQDDAVVDFTAMDAQKYEPNMRQAENRYRDRFRRWCQSHDLCKTTIYIAGAGGSGKSTLSRAFADAKSCGLGYHTIAPKGKNTSFDMADGYNLEPVSIVNEVNGGMFALEQFLDTFDPRSAAKANSRNVDKLYAPSYILMNNSVNLEKFIYDLCFYPLWQDLEYHDAGTRSCADDAARVRYMNSYGGWRADKALQVRRRIAILVVLDGSTAKVFYRDDRYNAPAFYAFIGYPGNNTPYQLYGECAYSQADPATVQDVIRLIDGATITYYDVNNYDVTPLTAGRDRVVLGDPVVLPGHIGATDISIDTDHVITYNGKSYTVPDFNLMLSGWVSDLENYTVGQTVCHPGGSVFVMNYRYIAAVNNLMWQETVRRIVYPDILNRFMDIRRKRKEQGLWIQRT